MIKSRIDLSLFSLILSNIVAIIFSLINHLSVADVMLIYWWQSVVIGIFQTVKMINLKNFTTEGFTSGGKQVPATTAGKISTAIFFAFHYGFFHFGYLVFILTKGPDLLNCLPLAGMFFVNHLFSYLQNHIADEEKRQNLGHVMFTPYIRIIPMHLAIFAVDATGSTASLVYFQVLKTLADTTMHIVEHRNN